MLHLTLVITVFFNLVTNKNWSVISRKDYLHYFSFMLSFLVLIWIHWSWLSTAGWFQTLLFLFLLYPCSPVSPPFTTLGWTMVAQFLCNMVGFWLQLSPCLLHFQWLKFVQLFQLLVVFTIGVPSLLAPNGHLLPPGSLDGKQTQMFLSQHLNQHTLFLYVFNRVIHHLCPYFRCSVLENIWYEHVHLPSLIWPTVLCLSFLAGSILLAWYCWEVTCSGIQNTSCFTAWSKYF